MTPRSGTLSKRYDLRGCHTPPQKSGKGATSALWRVWHVSIAGSGTLLWHAHKAGRVLGGRQKVRQWRMRINAPAMFRTEAPNFLQSVRGARRGCLRRAEHVIYADRAWTAYGRVRAAARGCMDAHGTRYCGAALLPASLARVPTGRWWNPGLGNAVRGFNPELRHHPLKNLKSEWRPDHVGMEAANPSMFPRPKIYFS